MLKAVILAGGIGSRLSEETLLKPKPMIEIGGMPILWHILKIYSHHGIKDFVICLGYKGYLIKEYFTNYQLHNSDLTIDLKNNKNTVHNDRTDDWNITLIDTGEKTQTGGRIKRVGKYLDESFCLTYGDGVSNIDINSCIESHNAAKTLATMTVVKPPGRFGAALLENDKVTEFREKTDSENAWINGGFFVLEPEVLDYIQDDGTIFEREPLEKLSNENQLNAYKHYDYWQSMDTLRERNALEALWAKGNAPWKIWTD